LIVTAMLGLAAAPPAPVLKDQGDAIPGMSRTSSKNHFLSGSVRQFRLYS
jgi:hypothetical protein